MTLCCALISMHILDHIADRRIVVGCVAVMKDGASVQEEPSRPEQVTAVVANATNLVCRKCSCCEAWGTDPEVCYTSCCYAKSRLVTCGCAECRGK